MSNLRRRVVLLEARNALSTSPAPRPMPLRVPQDVVDLLAEQAEAVRSDPFADPLDRARTLTLLSGLALRAMDAAGGAARVEALERALKLRAVQKREADRAKRKQRQKC